MYDKEEVYRAIEGYLSKARFAGRVVRLGFISVGAATAGAAQFMDWDPSGPSGAQVVGIIATLLVLLGGVYTGLVDEGAPQQLETARKAIEKAAQFEAQYERYQQVYDIYEKDTRRVGNTYLSVMAMRRVLEAAAFQKPDGARLAHLFLEAAQEHLPDALSFQNHHQWTIGIYKAETGDHGIQELVLVAKLRAIDCDIARARKWPTGTGLAGIAFTSRKGLTVENVNDPQIRELIGANGQSRGEDSSRYVSYSIAPILVGPNDAPWGLVIATSNQEGHFSLEEGPGIKTDEAVRAVAGMMEIGVAFLESKSVYPQSGGTVDDKKE